MLTAGCITGGGEAEIAASMPSDTYETCRGGGGGALGEGVNFLSSGGGARTVSLGMSECELIGVLGDPAGVTPEPRAGAGRHVTMTYANPDGTATAYVFVDNALREMNRVSPTPQPLSEAAPPG
jgi:hypothetical protein